MLNTLYLVPISLSAHVHVYLPPYLPMLNTLYLVPISLSAHVHVYLPTYLPMLNTYASQIQSIANFWNGKFVL